MQQEKRRGKKGVILLALAIALLLVAFVPAAMAVPASVSVNNGAAVIGNITTALTFSQDDSWVPATSVTIQDNYNAGAFVLALPAHVILPVVMPYTYILQSNATPAVGGTFVVKVSWYNGASLLGSATATVSFDNTHTISVLAWNGATFGDYSAWWFGPVKPPQQAQGDFSTTGAPAHSVVYRVDSGPWTDLTVLPSVATFFYNGPINGFHHVDHYGVAATTLLTQGPKTTSVFGWDSVAPRWTVTGLNSNVWYGNAPINWSARVTDQPGSGVATATANYWRLPPAFPGSIFTTIGATPVEWTPYQYDVMGTITPDPTYDAMDPAAFTAVSLSATDMVQNNYQKVVPINFDLVAPHTTFDVTPAGAATSMPFLGFVWTNKPVTLDFLAMDPGAPTMGSGVAYTEYFIGDESMTAPGTPTRGSSVTITNTAPTGPVYVWYRSVDKAVPANVEPWQKLYVYFDNVAPTLTNDVPTTWIDGWDDPALSAPWSFWITFDASDPNSGIGPDLIQWNLPNWNNDPDYSDWMQIAPGDSASFMVGPVAVDDGIYTLNSKVSDRAGNTTTMATPVKIDTRPPVTDGASGWINGTVPYVLTGTDQATGAGVAATIYRVDQSTPWLINAATPPVGVTLDTNITLTGGQGSVHTIDFGSVDAALPYLYDAATWDPPSYAYGNLEGWNWTWGIDGQREFVKSFTGYKTRTVKLDVTPPVVTAMDPMNGEWQKGPAVINFTGTDVGSGYAYTEWSTDGGTTWHQGETATITGNSPKTGTVVTYHGVDMVGIKSADQTITVKVAATPPSVVAFNTTVKRGHRATFRFTVTSVTPRANVTILIRSLTGQTLSSHTYDLLVSGSQNSRSFVVHLKKGRYFIRIGAVDEAGNTQVKRGTAMLTVK